MMPAPLTPPDLDLRDFDWMPLDVARLRDSDLSVLAPGDAFRAAVLLWCAAWHQVPAGSLPKEERLLANLAGYGRDLKGWSAVRAEAMHGFIECSDGRFYHPVVCAKAVEADGQRKKQQKRTEAATSARRNGKRNIQRNDDRNGANDEARNEDHLTLPNPTLPSEAHASETSACRFEEFWEAYPKRDGDNPKLPAKLKFEALVKTGVDPEALIAGAKSYAEEARRKGQIGTQYIAHALKWLTQQRWADAAAAAFVTSEGLKVVASKVFVVAGTPEWLAHERDRRDRGLKPAPILEEKDERRVPTGRQGFWFDKAIPDGFDQATAEKLPPKSDEAAA